MVHNDGQNMVIDRGLQDAHTQRPLPGHVEAFGDCRLEFGEVVNDVPVEFRADRRDTADALIRNAVVCGERRTEDLVPGHHVDDGLPQRVEVEIAGHAQDGGNVVGRVRAVEPVDEPHPLLCERERNVFGP